MFVSDAASAWYVGRVLLVRDSEGVRDGGLQIFEAVAGKESIENIVNIETHRSLSGLCRCRKAHATDIATFKS